MSGQDLTLRLSLPPRLPDFGFPGPRAAWTLVGVLAVPLWATWPSLAVAASSIPPFGLLGLACLVAWLFLKTFSRPASDENASFRNTAIAASCCAVGLTGSNVLYVVATKYIPPAQAYLTMFSWPIMFVMFGALAGVFTIQKRHLLGLAFGFTGAAIVIGFDGLVSSGPGIAIALASGASWALYCLFRVIFPAMGGQVLANGCGISALVCLVLHAAFETMSLPSLRELITVLAIGVVPLALGNLAWDHGIRRGDGRILATVVYSTPLVGVLVLSLFGLSQLTVELLFGGIAIGIAGWLSSANDESK